MTMLVITNFASSGTDCQNGDGADYNGTVATTTGGHACQVWTESRFPLLPANHCRNPTGHTSVWCYTVDGPRWEGCDVPVCPGAEVVTTASPPVAASGISIGEVTSI